MNESVAIAQSGVNLTYNLENILFEISFQGP